MRSILKRLIALSILALVAPYRAGALGLGDIKLNSYLNQPLNAKITVLPGNAGPLDQVRVKLASQAAFEQAGIERLPVLNHIKFTLVKGKDGKPQVKLSSDEPIKEPFLDFILQVTWANGRISREYTVLLDPPTTTAEQAPPVEPATTASTQPQGVSQPAAVPARTGTPATAASAAAGTGAASHSAGAKLTKDAYGRTQRDDTLWSIAKTVRPDDSVTVQQVMLALVKKNPQAFYKGNVNTLKAGYILRLPNKTLIDQVNQTAALHEVQRQYHQWQQIKQGSLLADSADTKAASSGKAQGPGEGAKPPKGQGAKPGTSTAAGGNAAKGADEARLTLLPANADKAGAGGVATVSAAKQGQAGAGDAALQKQLDSVQQTQAKQIDALRSQVNELNQQVASMQRLLSLKDDTLSTLQKKLGNAQGAPATAQVIPKPVQAAKTPAPAKPKAAQPTPVPATKPAAPAPKPHKVAPPVHAHADTGLLADPKVLGMGGVVVLLLSALSWLSIRRRRTNAEAQAPEVEDAAAAEAAADQEAPAEEVSADGGQPYMPTGGDLLEAEINEIDPLAEADVYMAYRRYQQAEDLLKGAIDQEPNRHELRLKLGEVFAAAGNAPAFVAEAQTLYNELDGQDSPIWKKMQEMGREIQPDYPLFVEGGGAATSGAAAGQAVEGSQDAVSPVVDEGAGQTDAVAATVPEHAPSVDAGVPDPAPTADTGDSDGASLLEEAAGLEAELSSADLDMDLSPVEPVEEPLTQAVADQGSGVADQDNGIEFESGLNQPAAAETEQAAGGTEGPQGNEIDFELPAGDELKLEEEPADAAADRPEADPLAADLVGSEDSAPAADVEGRVGDDAAPAAPGAALDGTVATGGAVPLMEADGAPALEDGAAPEAEAAKPSNTLDFDIDFDKIAGRDQDFDNFFEELESTEMGAGDNETDAAAGHQEVGTKLDLAKAFMEMGDQEGAKEILQEVVDLGDDEQKQEAQGLLQQLQV